MKKILSAALAPMLSLTLISCGKADNTSSIANTRAEKFVKPTDYFTVLLVTINPQFRL